MTTVPPNITIEDIKAEKARRANIPKPQEGPQEEFANCEADIILFGGQAGGGKSYASIAKPIWRGWHLLPGFNGIIFRRNIADALKPGSLVDESESLWRSQGGKFIRSPIQCSWAGGGKIAIGHLEHENTVYDHQSAQYGYIAFEELTHFLSKQFWYMVTRLRSVTKMKPCVVANFNPDPDSWVKDLITPWLDEEGEYPDKSKSGKIMYICVPDDAPVIAETREELEELYPEVAEGIMSITFIPSELADNKILEQKDPTYRMRLMVQNKVDRERLARGNWKIRAKAGIYFKREKSSTIPLMLDDVVQWIRYWDRAASKPTPQYPDPDFTAGALLGLRTNGKVLVRDVKMFREDAADVQKAIKDTYYADLQLVGDNLVVMQTDPGQAGKVEVVNLTQALAGLPVIWDPVPKTAKKGRIITLSAPIETGMVEFYDAPYLGPLWGQLENFPNGHDDGPDALAGGYTYLNTNFAVAQSWNFSHLHSER